MKTLRKLLLFFLIMLGCLSFSRISSAQAPPPPPAEKGTNTNKAPGGGAPLDGGLFISLAMVAGFGGWKWYKAHKQVQLKS